MKKIIVILFILLAFASAKAQRFDSLRVYTISMQSAYYIRISWDMIDIKTKPIIITDSTAIAGILSTLSDKIKGKFIEDLESNYIDVRLTFEFYRDDKMVQIIGVTSYDNMFFEKKSYSYKRKRLKLLNKYIPGITDTLGVK